MYTQIIPIILTMTSFTKTRSSLTVCLVAELDTYSQVVSENVLNEQRQTMAGSELTLVTDKDLFYF